MAAQSTSIGVDTEPAPVPADADVLTAHELYRLTLYKWRYSLEAAGFNPREVADLLFLKWLHSTRRLLP